MDKENVNEKSLEVIGTIADGAISIFFGIGPIGAVNKVIDYVMAVKEEALLCKIRLFLDKIKTVTEGEIQSYCGSNNIDVQDFKNNLLRVVDQLDEENKSTIVGNLTEAALKGKISHATLLRLVAIVNKAFLTDLIYLNMNHKESERYDPQGYIKFRNENGLATMEATLSSLGLMNQTIKTKPERQALQLGGQSKTEIVSKYKISELGELLCDHGIKIEYGPITNSQKSAK